MGGRTAKFLASAVITFFVTAAGASAAPQGPWVLPAADLSASGQGAFGPQVANAADGSTTAIWFRSDGSNDIVQAATRLPGGSFGTPVNVSTTGMGSYDPQIAIAPDGTVTAV